MPEEYDRATFDAALTAVPPEAIRTGIFVGTPEQISRRLKEFGEAGLRHVVLGTLSSYISVWDTAYTGAAVRQIAHLLRS